MNCERLISLNNNKHTPKLTAKDLDGIELLDHEDLIKIVKKIVNGGVALMFHGKRKVQKIQHCVRHRATSNSN
jgi:hypothetical protein